MFLEKNKIKKGRIEVICGSMFSGKTEELIRRIRRAKIAKQSVIICKPSIENRYDKDKVVSHNMIAINCIAVGDANDIIELCQDKDVVGIDEAQFFNNNLVEVCNLLANQGVRVIIAALDMDYEGNPFEPIPQLMSIAEDVTKVRAICIKCGDLANYSYRTIDKDDQILLGEKNKYEARCRNCFSK
ncbi:MAG: thymidine kinase [Flavobacteriales bacterium]|nr:thymidine kinase [Flavobacteriales bacterium]